MNLRDMVNFSYELRKRYGNFWERIEELLDFALECETEGKPLQELNSLIGEKELQLNNLTIEVESKSKEVAALREELERPLKELRRQKESLIVEVTQIKGEMEQWQAQTRALKKSLAAIF